MIRRNSKNRKNPSVASDLITTSIKPVGSKFKVTALIGNKKILDVEERFSDYATANKASQITKNILIKTLDGAKRSNPDELENSFKQAIGGAIALPDNAMSAFELGRLHGIQMSLTKYCGALNFFERRGVLKTINREISDALGHLARKIAVRGEGIEGPVPFVKKSTPKN